ncbi:hypothetical protein [Leptolyngbya sp. AN02str]|uniref:hypothetical protein n=1 Tax=Leptolyngbya sp. AN02str TaxID=3423363 RepID=UPI003D322AB1
MQLRNFTNTNFSSIDERSALYDEAIARIVPSSKQKLSSFRREVATSRFMRGQPEFLI